MGKGFFHNALILLLPFFITSCTKTKPETTGDIEGIIIDKITTLPIQAAEVKFSGSNQTVFSGADGSYKYRSLEAKEYQITVSKQNYVPETKPISVIARQTANLDFALSPFSLSITPANQNVGDTAGTTQFTITSNISWTASIDQSWCTLDKTSGSGNDIITVTHLVNTTMSERRATLTVTGNALAPEHVTLTQSLSVFLQVIICDQVWMVKNLDVSTYRDGTPIPEVQDPTAWAALTTGAWCYLNNDPANGTIYGRLYNWYAVNGDSDGDGIKDKELAPLGWHVPSHGEWGALSGCVGPNGAGKLMSTEFWVWPNPWATNETGFTGLPGGDRNGENGQMNAPGGNGWWWSTTEYIEDLYDIDTWAWCRFMTFQSPMLEFNEQPKKCGFSVRCLRD